MELCSSHIPVPGPFPNFPSPELLPSPQEPPSSGKQMPNLSTAWESPSAAQGCNQPWAQTFPHPNTHFVPRNLPKEGQAQQHLSPSSTPGEENTKGQPSPGFYLVPQVGGGNVAPFQLLPINTQTHLHSPRWKGLSFPLLLIEPLAVGGGGPAPPGRMIPKPG